MADPMKDVFNGAVLTFNGDAVGRLEDCEWRVGGQKVDVCGHDDLMMLYGLGLDDIEVTCTVKGTSAIARGDTGAISVDWNSSEGTNDDPIDNVVVSETAVNGAKNGPITTKITFAPARSEE